MANWTNEQLEAITKTGSNIIVSAGAGSGKTAVLSERVLDKIKNGIHVNELLILTFTKAAASEMKDRIRKKISKNKEYSEELNLLNSSYITTFDSFALSVVKKYHYLLNISSDISICDESIVILKEKEIMDDIFEELYSNKDSKFLNLIDTFCVKNDKLLRENILKIANKINDKINKFEYLDYLKDEYFSEENVNKYLNDYEKFINNKKKDIKMELDNLNYYFDSDLVLKFSDSISSLLNSSINDLHLFTKVSLPRVSKYPSDESREVKENFKSLIDDLLSFGVYGTLDDIKYSIISNKELINCIVNIVYEYINKLSEYKKENNIYTFSDIASLSIKILRDYESAREELKYSFKEIMIDEYQDTNDVQDIFISLIENNNVYMVGDIKQSIYKFRGSNPNIFKDKYDNYSKNNGGYKIDLIKNFRSRSEVLNNINRIFELIMDDSIGGASYKKSHEMIYGNNNYDSERLNDFNYNIEILEYEKQKDSKFSNIEIEIFSIANDIKNKIESKIKVFDKDNNKLRDVTYNDFVIILDRSKYFDNFKKVFEYLGIPLTILKDDKLNTSSDILLIKNIIDFIIRINGKDFGVNFRYDFISIGRSFLFEYSDEYIFDCFKNNSFYDSDLYKTFSNIENINSINSCELFEKILDVSDFYDKISKVGEYENINVRLNTLYDISNNLNDLGLSISEFRDYLEEIIESGIDIKYNAYKSTSDSVKILTIHKSKGLEYPICYFADLDHKFNLSDSNDLFVVSDYYGLIIPNVLNDNDTSILKRLFKNDYIKDEISEKIRLFYVALTRAREKMIVVLPKKETRKLEKDEFGVIDEIRRLDFMKLSDLIYSVKDYLNEYFSDIDISKIGLTKNYLFKKSISSSIKKLSDSIVVDEININNNSIEESHFSKDSINIITKDEMINMKYGTKIHEVLEYIDFKNYDETLINDKFVREKVTKFLNSDLMSNINSANIYKEYEFKYCENNTIYHGIIDLMLEYSTHIDIIDYKLKSITDKKYIDQLNGYKKYINSITNKSVDIYLYSILDEMISKI